jgi:hypothetical protein
VISERKFQPSIYRYTTLGFEMKENTFRITDNFFPDYTMSHVKPAKLMVKALRTSN